MVENYGYEKATDTLRVFFVKVDKDSFTKKIAEDVFLLKGMISEKLNGLIIKNTSRNTQAKQEAIEAEGIDGVIIKDMISG